MFLETQSDIMRILVTYVDHRLSPFVSLAFENFLLKIQGEVYTLSLLSLSLIHTLFHLHLESCFILDVESGDQGVVEGGSEIWYFCKL